ncbi:hypothetical protein [Acinetobacter seifertii]|uniref:Uncharacterized protein n=1 Tax=Acinetobacter seifertii TaxID=1530123 RepID=A0A7H2QPK2_9GAMM|nr:hypothetical protein [Acinetobacter seifertii]QNX06605.1 hypothetical protein IC796_06885 [Acinetobacter seifertii]QNX17035.1 hypothetical protein IC793_07125 [Acinetobacter seifertii]
MKKINLYIFILLSPFAHAEPSHDMARFQELGALHVQKYNNPQCRALRDFAQNTASHYRRAYNGQQSLKKADENAHFEAMNAIKTIVEQDIPLPFNYQFLVEQSSVIRKGVFSGHLKNSEEYLDGVYNKCASLLAMSEYSNNDNYERVVDYSKGEDKRYHPKITKIEEVCDRADFPDVMEKARTNIKDFAKNKKLTTEQFLDRSNYLSINRLAEDMLQAGLDERLINIQFLLNLYNAPKLGLKTGHLQPRCIINR